MVSARKRSLGNCPVCLVCIILTNTKVAIKLYNVIHWWCYTALSFMNLFFFFFFKVIESSTFHR